MSFQNLVRLSQIKKCSLPDYAHVTKVPKKLINRCELCNVIQHNNRLCYDIYDRFTILEHFPLRQSMILTTSFFCS
jgi:hypothetical protein